MRRGAGEVGHEADVVTATGDSGLTEYGWRTNRPASGKVVAEAVAERKLSDDLKKRFRIYFPTRETVARSKGGIGVSDLRGHPTYHRASNIPSKHSTM